VFANWYNNVANIGVQNRPYGNIFVDNGFRSGAVVNNQQNVFDTNASNGQSVYYYYGKSIDANGIITYQGQFNSGFNTTYGGPRWQSDFTNTGNTGAFTTKACQPPRALSGSYNYFFISEIKNSKPMIYMPALGQNNFASTYSSLPTGFVFDTTNACPIEWIEETQTLRVWGSDGTAVTYTDVTTIGTPLDTAILSVATDGTNLFIADWKD
jgi:hypothetical protein